MKEVKKATQTTKQIRIDSKLHAKLKKYANKTGRIIGKCADSAIAQYLEMQTGEEMTAYDRLEQK